MGFKTLLDKGFELLRARQASDLLKVGQEKAISPLQSQINLIRFRRTPIGG